MHYKNYQPSIPYNLLNRRGTYYRATDEVDENGARKKEKVCTKDFFYHSTEDLQRELKDYEIRELGVAYCRGNLDETNLPITGYIEWEDGETMEIYKAKREVDPTPDRHINHTKIYVR